MRVNPDGSPGPAASKRWAIRPPHGCPPGSQPTISIRPTIRGGRPGPQQLRSSSEFGWQWESISICAQVLGSKAPSAHGRRDSAKAVVERGARPLCSRPASRQRLTSRDLQPPAPARWGSGSWGMQPPDCRNTGRSWVQRSPSVEEWKTSALVSRTSWGGVPAHRERPAMPASADGDKVRRRRPRQGGSAPREVYVRREPWPLSPPVDHRAPQKNHRGSPGPSAGQRRVSPSMY